MSTELAKVDHFDDTDIPDHELTPAQARVEAVSHCLNKAMERASTLKLTDEERTGLKADFPDDAFRRGATGDERLIYIEHAHLRDRLDAVLGVGQWTLVRTRPHWAENFKTSKGQDAVRLYADCALLVRGCLVGEAIGSMDYYPNNAKTNYGDAAEGAETAAFRRCAKKFSVGLQAWKKDFCAGWEARNPIVASRPPFAAQNAPPTTTAPKRAYQVDAQKRQFEPKQKKPETVEQKLVWLFTRVGRYPKTATEVFRQFKLIGPEEQFGALKPETVAGWDSAKWQSLLDEVKEQAQRDADGLELASGPEVPRDPDVGHHERGGWADGILPFAPKDPANAHYKGHTLSWLFENDSKYAFGLAMNYTAEPWVDREGIEREPSPESIAFEAACATWRQEHGKEA